MFLKIPSMLVHTGRWKSLVPILPPGLGSYNGPVTGRPLDYLSSSLNHAPSDFHCLDSLQSSRLAYKLAMCRCEASHHLATDPWWVFGTLGYQLWYHSGTKLKIVVMTTWMLNVYIKIRIKLSASVSSILISEITWCVDESTKDSYRWLHAPNGHPHDRFRRCAY